MSVGSVTVNGAPAAFTFVQPTYPGDPNGQNDPDPLAHEASQNNPVGGPDNNPLPPACSPELPDTSVAADSLDGTQCPANKLVITPRAPIRDGSIFTVVVQLHRPAGRAQRRRWHDRGLVPRHRRQLRHHRAGRHRRLDAAQRLPGGQADLRLLRHGQRGQDHARQRRSHIGRDRTRRTRTSRPGRPPTTGTPAAPIASYLVEDSVGNYTFSTRLGSDGITYKEAQDSSISATQQATNQAVMDQQQDITDFESQFNGPFPFDTDGVAVGTPPASFEEEMQTMITFAGGRVGLEHPLPREHAPVVG